MEKQLREEGNLKKHKVIRPFKKIAPEKLIEHVKITLMIIIVAAQNGHKIIEPFEYSGIMDAELFEFWIEKCLMPQLSDGAVIILDNAPFHRKKQLKEMAEKHVKQIIFYHRIHRS